MVTLAIRLDTHKLVTCLRASGFEEKQAEAVMNAMRDAVGMTEAELNRAFNGYTSELKEDLRLMERKLEQSIELRAKELQVKLGGMIMALGGVLIAIKYLG